VLKTPFVLGLQRYNLFSLRQNLFDLNNSAFKTPRFFVAGCKGKQIIGSGKPISEKRSKCIDNTLQFSAKIFVRHIDHSSWRIHFYFIIIGYEL